MSASTLHLRPLNDADAPVMAGWATDELFCRHAGWPVHTVESIRDFWRRQIVDPPSGLVRLAVWDDDGTFLQTDSYYVQFRIDRGTWARG